jgi:transcriptional regulator with XRE-family HTH domain
MMATSGQILRQAREQRGVALQDIARETRISTRYLEAIENEDTRTLPKDFFYRSFVRQYAAYMGITAEVDAALQRENLAAAPVESQSTPASSALFAPRPAVAASAPPVRPALDQSFVTSDNRTNKVWLAAAAILVVGSVSYLAWRKSGAAGPSEPKADPVTRRVSESAASPNNPPGGLVGGPNGAPAAVVQTGKLKITIAAKEPTWIQISGDGKNLYVGLLEAGQSTQVESADGKAELLVGNAGGVSIEHNGKALPEVGPRGQVRTIVFDLEKYEIRAPQPKPKTEESIPEKKENSTVDAGRGLRAFPSRLRLG